MLLLIDGSMSGWRPKTKKLGGLPNYTFESCKPVPLGTIFCNAVECISGLLLYKMLYRIQNKIPEGLQFCSTHLAWQKPCPGLHNRGIKVGWGCWYHTGRMGRWRLLVWQCHESCWSWYMIWSKLNLDYKADSAMVSNETTVCSAQS